MRTRFRLFASAAVIAAVALLTVGGGGRIHAESCTDEETATEECFLDGPAFSQSAPAPGASPEGRAQVEPAIVPGHRPSLRIWTDRRHYYVGDDLRVCYRVPGPGRIQITDILPDGHRQVLWSYYEDGRGNCLWAWVTPPTGKECLVLRWVPSWYGGPSYGGAEGGSPSAQIAPALVPITPRPYFARTCFQTSGHWDWDWGWDYYPYWE
jgi:hypothetical protein